MHYVLHFGIHENAFTITQNSLTLQLLGALIPRPPAGALHPCTSVGAQLPDPLHPPSTIFWLHDCHVCTIIDGWRAMISGVARGQC